MINREEAKNHYSMWNNITHALKEMKFVGFRYYGYLTIDIITQITVPFCMVLIPAEVIRMLQTKQPLFDMLTMIVFWLGGILILNILRTFTHQKLENMATILTTSQYYRKLNLDLLSCDLTKIESHQDREFLYEAMSSLNNRDGMGKFAGVVGFYIYGISLCVNLGGFLLYALIAGDLHPILLIILFSTSLINCYAKNKAINYQFSHMKAFWDNAEDFWYMKNESINTEKAKDIRMYHLFAWFKQALDKNTTNATKIYGSIMNIHLYADSVICFTSLLRDGVAYLFLIYQLSQGKIDVPTFVLYLGIVAGFGNWITQIVENYTYLGRISHELSLIRCYIETITIPKQSPYRNEVIIPKQCATIDFENIDFGYQADQLIFQQFSLHLKAGEKIALVGINGAGKTTLTKLLCGLYPVIKGCIKVDDVDISTYTKDQYYQYISILFQDVHVLPFSIAKNVACAWNDPEQSDDQHEIDNSEMAKAFHAVETSDSILSTYDEAKVIACLKAVKLWDKVSSLPNGIHTVLTKILASDGMSLSGGETQRLMLARALYKDAPILILDEPTSALDPIAESELYEEYAQLCENKISIFISHRLSSTRFCDRILFMENGRILEEGTHDELMNKQGKYAEMYQIQSHYYQMEVAKHEAGI